MNKEKRAAEKRAARNHKEDVVLNRVLVWFGAAVVAELLTCFSTAIILTAPPGPARLSLLARCFTLFRSSLE